MSAKPQALSAQTGDRVLTLAVLEQQNEHFRGSGGVSEENRSLGFKPAFYDMSTGITHPSRFANGRDAPMHVLDGLPDDLVLSRQENGRVSAVKPGVIAGFVLHAHFYTREQAAQATRQMRDRSQLLSNPELHNQMLDAWEHFVVDQSYPSNLIRPVIEDSWRRCYESHVDPLTRQAPLSERDEFEEKQYRNQHLLRAAEPVLRRAGELLFRSDSLILLADRDGLILNIEADREVRYNAGSVNLIEGGQWGEAAVGTNAVGTAIAAAEPVQLYGAEHFCFGIKRWTCSADVIRDPHDGRILGAVDLSGLTPAYQHDALDFAIMAARLIEANLAQEYFQTRQKVIDATTRQFREWSGEGLLAFDRRGRLVKANLRAHQVLQEMGSDLQLTPQTREPALDIDLDFSSGRRIPDWLDHQLRQPIQVGHEQLGTLVIFTAQH